MKRKEATFVMFGLKLAFSSENEQMGRKGVYPRGLFNNAGKF